MRELGKSKDKPGTMFLLLWWVIILESLGYGGTQSGIHADSNTKRPVTVADAITMTRLGDYDYSFNGLSAEGRVAGFSPDGKKCVVGLRKGNLEQNTNDYSLLILQTSRTFKSQAPKDLLTMS